MGLGWFRAKSADKRGSEALDSGRFDDAVEAFTEAIRHTPASSAMWFNLGLAHKFRRDWPASLEANVRSAELEAGNKEALWNAGVAATAIRDWERAAWAWDTLGFPHGEKPGPPHMNYVLAPVRLNPDPDGGGEVIWGWRIDPCRIRIHNVPFAESGHRWDDVVLHDVVPRGERHLNGRTYSVFDELLRMDPSPHQTHRVDLFCPTEADSEALAALFYDNGLGAEDWTTKVQWLCATCSVGSAHVHEESNGELTPVRSFGLAGPPDRIRERLSEWEKAGPGRSIQGELTLD
jgi:hypothetical protein